MSDILAFDLYSKWCLNGRTSLAVEVEFPQAEDVGFDPLEEMSCQFHMELE